MICDVRIVVRAASTACESFVMILCAALLVAPGCSKKSAPTPVASDFAAENEPRAAPSRDTSPPVTTDVRPTKSSGIPPKIPAPVPAALPDELFPPVVVMSDFHAQTCLVKVGDTLPGFTLPRREGGEVTLGELRGDKFTVVVFWSMQQAFGREQFLRLERETAAPFADYGVNVVAVNVGDTIEQVDELLSGRSLPFPCLLDFEGEAFARVATRKLPRTYLLDPDGTILWFDIEYSQATERELRNAIYWFLQDPPDAQEQAQRTIGLKQGRPNVNLVVDTERSMGRLDPRSRGCDHVRIVKAGIGAFAETPMEAKDGIVFTMDHALKVLTTYLSDVSDEEMMTRPAPGANHLKWQIGHLIGAEAYFLNAIAPGTGILLPEGHADKHSKENNGSDDPADFLTKDEYLDLFHRQREATKAALADYPVDKLDDPAPEGLRERFPTVGDVFLLMGDHVMMHAGQFAIARRLLKKPILI